MVKGREGGLEPEIGCVAAPKRARCCRTLRRIPFGNAAGGPFASSCSSTAGQLHVVQRVEPDAREQMTFHCRS